MLKYLSLVKFAHTIFALPFAMIGFFMAINLPDYQFDWVLLILVLGCMVFARSAAMAFNRYADKEIDKRNARTARREIPSGKMRSSSVLAFALVNSGLFVLCTAFINPLCFALSPIALLIILGYSYTKRFTWLSHFILGLGLALAPVGAYISVTGRFDPVPVLLGLVVLLWVSGFDIIYAMQDRNFDLDQKLKSVPVRFGGRNALFISTFLHAVCGIILVWISYSLSLRYPQMSYWHWLGTGIFIVLLVYQHLIVSARDLSKVNIAFFTTNGVASVIFGVLLIADFYI